MKSVHYILATTIGVASLSLLAGCGGGGNPSVSSSAVSPALGSPTRVVDPYPNYIAGPDAIPNSYIVMLKDGTSTAAARTTTTAIIANPVQVAADNLVATYGGTVGKSFDEINQFTATMTVSQAQNMSNDTQVYAVVTNCPAHETAQRILINNPNNYAEDYSPGLDLVDQQNLVADGKFNYTNTGTGIDVYVMDSGIKSNHIEFQGKVIDGRNFQNDRGSTDITDDNGHGTAVASILAGNKVGVAPGVTLHILRIAKQLNGRWTSDQERILDAMNYLVKDIKQGPTKRRVLNCSFGTKSSIPYWKTGVSTTTPVDNVVKSLIDLNVTVVASAANNNEDAWLNSPGGTVTAAIVVGAAERNGYRSGYSNYGNVIDLFACPETQVANAYAGLGLPYTAFAGTSAAAPLVSGTAALYLQTNGNQNSVTRLNTQVEGWLISNSTKNILNTSSLMGSPNRMLYKGNL
jgi:subtilisin family serine protease